MIRALLTGTLHADPQTRVGQSGKPYCTARLRADTGDGNTTWCSLIAFGDVAERLTSMKAGAAISVSGRAKLSSWLGKDGSPAAGLSVVVDELATLRGRPKPPSDRRQAADTSDADRWHP